MISQDSNNITAAVNEAQQAFFALKRAQLEYMQAEIEYDKARAKIGNYTLHLDKYTQQKFDEILSNN